MINVENLHCTVSQSQNVPWVRTKKGIYLEDCKADAIGLAMLVDKWASILWPTVMSTPGVERRNEAASCAHEE